MSKKCDFEGCKNDAEAKWGYAGCTECFNKILKKRRKYYPK